MMINKFVTRIFSGKLFKDGLYDDSEDYDKPRFHYGYPWAMIYFQIDNNTIIAYGVENARQSPAGLLKKAKNYHFEVDFTIQPKVVKTDFGKKITYYAQKVDLKDKKLNQFPNLN